jgi:hypothetical protein
VAQKIIWATNCPTQALTLLQFTVISKKTQEKSETLFCFFEILSLFS